MGEGGGGARFGGEAVVDVHGGADDERDFGVHAIPDFFFVLDDLLVVPYLQVVEFVHLALEHDKRFAEALHV